MDKTYSSSSPFSGEDTSIDPLARILMPGKGNRLALLGAIMNPRAMQLLQLASNVHQRQADQARRDVIFRQQQQLFEQQQQDRAHQRELATFNLDRVLRGEGYTPVSDNAANEAPRIAGGPFASIEMPKGFNAGDIVKAPGGKSYRPPSKQQREEEEMSRIARIEDFKRELTSEQMRPVPVPEKLQPLVGQAHLMVPQSKVIEAIKNMRDAARGNIQRYQTARGLVFYNQDEMEDRLAESGQPLITVPTPELAPPRSNNYSERDKNAATIRALAQFKQRYPGGKETREWQDAVRAWLADNPGKTDRDAHAALLRERTARRYGSPRRYVQKPEDDLEFHELYLNELEKISPGASGSAAPPSASPAKKPAAKIDRARADAQIGQYKALSARVSEEQRAQLEAALIQDLIASGVVKNEAEAKSYIAERVGR